MNDRIRGYYNCALNLALEYLKQLAINCLKENEKLTGFSNSMGVYYFFDNLDIIKLENLPKTQSAKNLLKLYEEWDKYLKLTGYSIRLEKMGDKIEILYNW